MKEKYLLTYGLFNDAVNISSYIALNNGNDDDLERMWKKAFLVKFQVIRVSQHLYG
jgi:hypothetical protein